MDKIDNILNSAESRFAKGMLRAPDLGTQTIAQGRAGTMHELRAAFTGIRRRLGIDG